ncbi:MAG: hypothetical protein ABJD11_01695 [Gemmatimonadota bacterium]
MNDVVRIAGMLLVLIGVPLGLIAVLAPTLLRRPSKTGLDPAAAEELASLRVEVAELRALPRRVAELEQRVEFAERMLTASSAQRILESR